MLRLGTSFEDGSPVELTIDERRQGTYIIGTTGTGKSTLLKNIIYQDLKQNFQQEPKHGLCLLDPHGDLVDDLLGLVPNNRIDDVIFFNPMNMDRPFGLNMLSYDKNDPEELYWVVSAVMGSFSRLFSYSWGPRLEHVLRNALLTALTYPGSSFIELLYLLMSTKEERKLLAKEVQDPLLKKFWETFPESERLEYELVSSTLNKVAPFITDIRMRNIIGQSKNTINLQDIMNEGKILFVNLSKGDLGEDNSSLIGSTLVNLIWLAALKRRTIPQNQRRPFHLIVDEFQNFATESFAILQSEARKYAVDVVVAHQFRDQLDDLSKGSTLNVGNMVVFRVSGRDSYALASQFDNTPPPPDTRVEPVYREYQYQGTDFLIETKLNTSEGKLYQETELPRRPYSDVEAEMANRLSILPNYQAWGRFIYNPESHGKQGIPRLVEHQFAIDFHKNQADKTIEELRTIEERNRISDQIKSRSYALASTRKDVEEEIDKHIRRLTRKTEEPIAGSERLSSEEKTNKNRA